MQNQFLCVFLVIVGLVCFSAHCFNYTAKVQCHFNLYLVESKYWYWHNDIQ